MATALCFLEKAAISISVENNPTECHAVLLQANNSHRAGSFMSDNLLVWNSQSGLAQQWLDHTADISITDILASKPLKHCQAHRTTQQDVTHWQGNMQSKNEKVKGNVFDGLICSQNLQFSGVRNKQQGLKITEPRYISLFRGCSRLKSYIWKATLYHV